MLTKRIVASGDENDKIASLDSPTEHPTVVAAEFSKPVQPKQLLDLETVIKVAHSFNIVLASLADIRFLPGPAIGWNRL